MKNRGCQITGDFLVASQPDWLQVTKSVSFHLWERKIDIFEMEKIKWIKHQKYWKGPRIFLKRPSEKVIITKNSAKL